MPGAVLDIEQPASLARYLRETGRVGAGEIVKLRTLAGGVSNKTVLVERPGGEAWVLKQALSKLRVRADWFSDPARVHREALGLVWLERLAPAGATTPLIFQDERHHLLAMAAVPQPHANWKSMLLEGRVEDSHVEQFGRLLGRIHRGGHERRGELETVFADRSFFESLRVEPYYAYSAAQIPEASPFLHDLIDHTRARRLTLVHGDYSPKNVLVRLDTGLLVLLDHEVIHFGDPAFDLGFALAHLLSKAHHLPRRRGEFFRAAALFREAYRIAVGPVPWLDPVEADAARHALGCLLARVAGRSPLEYLCDAERRRQARAAVELMRSPPDTLPGLFSGFAARL